MHRGVQRFVRWVTEHRSHEWLKLNRPATAAELLGMEQQLGVPLPGDLRLVLSRFNGADLPSGQLLPAGTGPGTIEAEVRKFAEQEGLDFLDPELPLPFHRTSEGSLLCFDRSAGPVSDTWPIVDYYEDTGEVRLVYRTFDGWCRLCIEEWQSPDFMDDFSLDKYMRQGERHASLEKDVTTAHATVAHAYRRAGMPEKALNSYLTAARCIPSLPWCDWEALKLAVLLGKPTDALEAASRLAARGPRSLWSQRETTPRKVAEVLSHLVGQGALARGARADSSVLNRLFEQLEEQEDEGPDRDQIRTIRGALLSGTPPPPPAPFRETSILPRNSDAGLWWQEAQAAYSAGQLRDDDLLLDASLLPLGNSHPLGDLLRIRREF